MRSGLPQPVTVESFPDDSKVYINGAYVGNTPLTLELPRRATHEVTLRKDGYIVQRKFFTPQRNERSQNLIRFGLMEDLGLYYDLTPTDMEARLRHSLVPMIKSSEPFAEMAYRVMLADALLDTGAISRAEHSEIYNRLTEFYAE